MSAAPIKPEYLEATIDDLKGVIESLQSQRQEIDDRLIDTQDRCAYFEKLLRSLVLGTEKTPVRRARRGETRRKVIAYLEAVNGQSFSIKDLAEKLELPWSSVRNVLVKGARDGDFVEEDGFYARRTEQLMKLREG